MDGLLDAPTETQDVSLEPTLETGQEAQPGTEGQAEQQTETPAADPFGSYDGRKFGKEINTAISELLRTNPTRAKEINALRDGYGRLLAVKELAPNGVKDIQAWKSTYDSLGGAEGAGDVLARVNQYEATMAKLAQGDASVFDADDLKGGIASLGPALFERMAKDNPDVVEQIIAPRFAASLAATGLGDHLRSMYAAAQGNEALQGQIKQAFDWFTRNTQNQPVQGGPKPNDPFSKERERFQNERQQFEQQKSEQVWTGIRTDVAKYQDDAIAKAAAPYLISLKLSPERQERFITSIKSGLEARANQDPNYKKTLDAYRDAKSIKPEVVSNFVKGKISEILESVIEAEAGYISPGRQTRTTTPADPAQPTQAASTGAGVPIRLAERPDNIDWRRTPAELIFKNQGYTTDGKLVQWPFKNKVAVN